MGFRISRLSAIRLCRLLRTLQEVARFDSQCVRNLPQHSDAGRHIGPFDGPDIADAQAGARCQLFLRDISLMTRTTQIDRHDLLEIHGDERTLDRNYRSRNDPSDSYAIVLFKSTGIAELVASRDRCPLLAIANDHKYDASSASIGRPAAAVDAIQLDFAM